MNMYLPSKELRNLKIAKLSTKFIVILFLAFFTYLVYQLLLSQNGKEILTENPIIIASQNKINIHSESKILNLISKELVDDYPYSEWPEFIQFSNENILKQLDDNHNLIKNACLKSVFDKGLNMSIDTLKVLLDSWSSSDNDKCIYYLNIIKLIYDIKFKQNNLKMSPDLSLKVQALLNNDKILLNTVYNQKLVSVYNKFTNEENVFNTLRPKRPGKKPDIPPSKFYEKTMNESKTNCDFCSIEYTAFSKFGRLGTSFSYSASNLFPFDEYHELFMPRKHDLLELSYKEFKDLLLLPMEWFKMVHKKNKTLNYPVLLWDFLYKGGASQVHPHLHGTLNSKRYYGMFETIRKGAECYYKQTKRNYFNDFTFLHDMLNLTFIHKNAIVIFPLTPKKDYDVTIMSYEFNDGIIELIYAILRTYFYDLDIYPFSMTIYYPFLSNESRNGKIPVYVKILPRGDISSLRSDASTLELMTTFNANLDQFEIRNSFKNLVKKHIDKIN